MAKPPRDFKLDLALLEESGQQQKVVLEQIFLGGSLPLRL